MKREAIFAQGEITVFRITGDLPVGLIKHMELDKKGRPIISHSEKGNHHILADYVDVMEHPDVPQGMRILYALIDKPTSLIQDAPDAHGAHMLEPGIIEFRIAREVDHFSKQVRRVAD